MPPQLRPIRGVENQDSSYEGLRNDVTYGISEGKNGYDELPEHK